MSDRDRLNSILQRLAKPAIGTAIESSSVQELMISLLRTIDETLLPRNIAVQAEGQSLVFHVAQRSLLNISGAIEANLAEAGEDVLATIGAEISQILAGKPLSVSIERPDTAPDPSAVGASVAALAAAWSDIQEAETGLKSLLEKCDSFKLWSNGSQIESGGDADRISAEDLQYFRDLNGNFAAIRTENASQTIFYARDGEEEVIALLDSVWLGPVMRSLGAG